MGLEKHPVLVSVLVSKKLSGLGHGLGLEACGLDYNTALQYLDKWPETHEVTVFSLFLTYFYSTCAKICLRFETLWDSSGLFFLVFICIFILLSRESDQSAITSSLSSQPSVSCLPHQYGEIPLIKCLSERHNK